MACPVRIYAISLSLHGNSNRYGGEWSYSSGYFSSGCKLGIDHGGLPYNNRHRVGVAKVVLVIIPFGDIISPCPARIKNYPVSSCGYGKGIISTAIRGGSPYPDIILVKGGNIHIGYVIPGGISYASRDSSSGLKLGIDIGCGLIYINRYCVRLIKAAMIVIPLG
jgi:hypothetical protein